MIGIKHFIGSCAPPSVLGRRGFGVRRFREVGGLGLPRTGSGLKYRSRKEVLGCLLLTLSVLPPWPPLQQFWRRLTNRQCPASIGCYPR